MKNLKIVYFYLLLISLGACKGDLASEGISKVTYFPVITLKGEQWSTIPIGETFTDPGVTATEAGKEISVEVTGDVVNTSVPGVYTIIYTASNVDGFSSSVRRYVGVATPEAVAQDLGGSYQRVRYGANTTAAGIATVRKLENGFYAISNIGGVPNDESYVYDVFFFNPEPSLVVVPVQENQLGGDIYVVNGTYDSAEQTFSYGIVGAGYGTPVRTFKKL